MPARVDAADVAKIYIVSSKIVDLSPIIDHTNRFVDSVLLGKGLTEAVLTDIELYLVPYFAGLLKPQLVTASVLSASSSRAGLFSYAGMLGDSYGQVAIQLDTSGTLLELAKSLQAAGRGSGDTATAVGFTGGSSADVTLLD